LICHVTELKKLVFAAVDDDDDNFVAVAVAAYDFDKLEL
jgi:hypothetical protein